MAGTSGHGEGTMAMELIASSILSDGRFSSSFLLTRYLPLYSSRCLPTFSIDAAQTQQMLACIDPASAINSLAT
jgi:hypothetical protein